MVVRLRPASIIFSRIGPEGDRAKLGGPEVAIQRPEWM